jgi:thiol-disulfide isomerase/thioredoxin
MSFLLLLALAQQTPVEFLAQVDENYKSLKTFHIETDTLIESSMETRGDWNRRQTVLIMESPTKLRFVTSGFIGQYEVVADGTNLWIAAGHLRQYVSDRVTGPVVEKRGIGNDAISALSSLRFSIPANAPRSRRLKSAEFLPEERVLDGGRSVVCKVVRGQYELSDGQTVWERTYWVDPVRLLVLKETSMNEGASSIMRPYDIRRSHSMVQHRHLHIGSLPKDYDFTFVPPANFAGVDRLEVTGMTMPKADLVGKAAPEVLRQYKGKPVLVHFWATWCGPCREQMPSLVKLHGQIKDQDVVMIGVNADESAGVAMEYAKKNGLEWTQWVDADHRAKFKVNAIPTMIVVDREGQVAAYEVGSGSGTEENLRSALTKLGVKF